MIKTKVQKGSRSEWAEKRRNTRQSKTWAQIARLADDAIMALEGGKASDVRRYLNAIRGVAACADEDGR